MPRSRPLALVSALAFASFSLVACARGEATGTTSLTSATAASEPTRIEDAALRLADEVCKRKASCVADAQNAGSGSSWSWTSTNDCVERERPRLQMLLGTWNCSPVSAEARLKSCLPAMKTATCEPLVGDDQWLPVCAGTESCMDPPRLR
jgi:hypothetical protein